MGTDSEFKEGDVYARVTNEIVRAIEGGVKKYEMPWHRRTGEGFPRNAATGNVYHGVNVIALWAANHLGGYFLPYWATFLQWERLGARIRRGEKGSVVVVYKREEAPEDGDDCDSEKEPRLITRCSFVFNAEQVDGWSCPMPIRVDRTKKIREVDEFIGALGAEVRYGGDSAYYSPGFDRIHMPPRESFIDRSTGSATDGFYSVLLHEHVHWSGGAERLKRDLCGRFGDVSYAMEELVAELGAAFLCADLGLSVQPRKDHAAYVANWLQVLREQKAAIFSASRTATDACRYLSELSQRRRSEPMSGTR